MIKLITVSGNSGAGKTEIGKRLADRLSPAKFLSFDDYDDKVIFPKNYPASMPEEYDISELFGFIEKEKEDSSEIIVFDYPFGRANKTMNSIIDFAVFLHVPLDVSMARRTRREWNSKNTSDCEWLLSELENWEKGARAFNIQWERNISKSCDLIVDSIGNPTSIINEIINSIDLLSNTY